MTCTFMCVCEQVEVVWCVCVFGLGLSDSMAGDLEQNKEPLQKSQVGSMQSVSVATCQVPDWFLLW